MQTNTVLLIILATIVALGLVLFQYYYKTKKRGKLYIFLSFLRFLGLFGIFLLLINPKFSKNEYSLEKARLLLLTDNSSSMASSDSAINKVLKTFAENEALNKNFNISSYSFGSTLSESDTLSFEKKNTNIASALASLNEIYNSSNIALIVLTDGNQTIGQDFAFYGNQMKFPIYPIAVGDTTQYEDVLIENINSNKYAFLKNKFPLEIDVTYVGASEVNTTLQINMNGKNVYRENLKLTNNNNVKTINALLNASSVGVKTIDVSLTNIRNERNTKNNKKNIAIEVIDEKTNITIISDLKHPDIGALKKSIESNEQRSVSIQRSNVSLKDLEDVDVFLLYQPNSSFRNIYKYIQQKKVSVFTITGTNTDWGEINKSDRKYRIADEYPTQEIFGTLNPSFTKFDISDFNLNDFPPLESNVGEVTIDNGETLLDMQILGKLQNRPLLFATDNENGKELVLFGENIWKWRMQSFRNNQNFENFDGFIGKLILYLSSNNSKNRLDVDFQTIYEGSNDAKIKAAYFDEAFIFDTNASLMLKLSSNDPAIKRDIPMLLRNGYYEADLSDLPPAAYNFKVTVAEENRSKSGNFRILDFDVEQQFTTTNLKKLTQLANTTNGSVYYPDTSGDLVSKLLTENQFKPTQKSTKNIVSLIDFRILLALIVAALATEWFIRKYNGLT